MGIRGGMPSHRDRPGTVGIRELQYPGKNRLPVKDFLRGFTIPEGADGTIGGQVNTALSDRIEEAKERETDHQPEKRIFILLLLLTCGGLIVVAVALWLIPYIGFTNIHPRLPLIMAVVFAVIVAFLIGGGLTLVLTILRGKNLFFNREIRGVVIRFLFPLLVIVGKFIGISKDQVRRSFVTINNQLVLAEARRVHPAGF